MLGLEHGMSTIRRLLTIIDRLCGSQAPSHEVGGMETYLVKTILTDVSYILCRQMKRTTEL